MDQRFRGVAARMGLAFIATLSIGGCSRSSTQVNVAKTPQAAARVAERDAPVSSTPPAAPPKVSAATSTVENDLRYKHNEHPIDQGVGGYVKVYGGTPVADGDFADTVGLAVAGTTAIRCTGTLIEPDIVLTAAHCVCDGIDGRIFIGNTANGKTPPVGVVGVKGNFSTRPNQTCPEDFGNLFGQAADLGLLLLDHPVLGVVPRAIADDATVTLAKRFHVVGFGAIDVDALKYPHDKREADVIAVSNSCTGRLNGNPQGAPDALAYGCRAGHEIIAGVRGGNDSCNGDSGGPLFVSKDGLRPAVSSALRLAGVTSRGTNLSQTMCGDGGTYTRLDAEARTWIQTNITALRKRRSLTMGPGR